MEGRLKFRADIDGLRAISVLAVMAFHLNIGIQGGFTGVDVFFVISGFLIGRIVYTEVSEGSFSLLRFYERRARRILPALLTVIAASWLLANLLLYDFEKADFSKSAIASILFVGNIYFFEASGYFSPAAETIPLLHLWSLGVEEQFYLLFPPFILILARYSSRGVFTALVMVGAASLLISQALVSAHPEAAFYLPISRAFEILVGSLLAHPIVPRPKGQLTSQLAGSAGAVCLMISMLFYNKQTAFPGIAALLPCIGAALILWSGQSQSPFVARLLQWRPLVYVGKISYSLYLVHWPIIVFGKLLLPNLYTWQFVASAAVAAFALAHSSFKYIETPLRYGRITHRRALPIAVAAMLAIGLLPGWTLLKFKLPASADPKIASILKYNFYNPRTRFLARECFLDPEQRFDDFMLSKCIPSAAGDAVILWGDSHAAHLYFGLRSELEKRGVSVGMLAGSGCPPILNLDVVERPRCKEVNDRILPLLLQLKPRTVILSAAWRMNEATLAKLKLTVERLLQSGIKVEIVGESPAFNTRAPNIAAARLQSNEPVLASEPDVKIESMEMMDGMLAAAFRDVAGLTYVSPYRAFCLDKQCLLLTKDAVPIYFDYSHLTEAGSVLYAKDLLLGKL